jgi:hypothetical protein
MSSTVRRDETIVPAAAVSTRLVGDEVWKGLGRGGEARVDCGDETVVRRENPVDGDVDGQGLRSASGE